MTFHHNTHSSSLKPFLFPLTLPALAVLLLISSPAQLQAQSQAQASKQIQAAMPTPTQNKTGSIQIESEKLVILHKKNQAIFTHHVHLTRDDFELFADRLVAYYNDNDLERAEAFGNIKLTQGDIKGHADNAILNQQSNTLTLIGNAVMEQQGNRLEGEKIIHDITLEKTLVFPAKGGRTHMTIESNDANNKPNKPAAGGNP